MKKSIIFRLLSISFLLITFFLNSCSDNVNETAPVSDTNHEYIRKIVNLGFNEKDIVDMGTYYVVENCILFMKDELDKNQYLSKTEQAVRNNVVNYNLVNSIRVKVDQSIPTSGTDNWRTEIAQAVTEWTNISNCRIIMTMDSSNADIRIYSDTRLTTPLDNYTIAVASWPTNGNPGTTIHINLDYYSNKTVPTLQKKYNMAHELGHCLGFRHTNWQDRGESSDNANTIGTTTDPSSVMNGGTAEYQWNGFSYYDTYASRELYGESYDATMTYNRVWDINLQDYTYYISTRRANNAPYYEIVDLEYQEGSIWYSLSAEGIQIGDDTWSRDVLPRAYYRAKVRNYKGDFITYTTPISL